MIVPIGHMEQYPTMGARFSNGLRYPRIYTERTGQVGERDKDKPMPHIAQSGGRYQTEQRTTTKTVVNDRKLVVEKYDQSGRLIRMTPPGYIPFDHVAHSILV